MAKKGQKFRKHSADFKYMCIMDIRENHLAYREAENKYNINHSVLMKWERIYLEKGISGLMAEKRGRPRGRGKPPKLDPKLKEDLIQENQRLRMENEYLKKLMALVQEEENLTNKKQK